MTAILLNGDPYYLSNGRWWDMDALEWHNSPERIGDKVRYVTNVDVGGYPLALVKHPIIGAMYVPTEDLISEPDAPSHPIMAYWWDLQQAHREMREHCQLHYDWTLASIWSHTFTTEWLRLRNTLGGPPAGWPVELS